MKKRLASKFIGLLQELFAVNEWAFSPSFGWPEELGC
jgi:hypothetical protein